MSRAQRNINILMMLLFSAYAIYSLLYQHASIFFIIYLFWFDEVIRTIYLFVQVKMHVEDIRLNREFTKKKAISHIKSRFFFLFVYAIFIVIIFGIFFHLNKEQAGDLIINVQIIMFRNFSFNICLMIAIVREIFQLREVRKNRYVPIARFSSMSGHLLTLHLSIIFGGLMWALTSGGFKDFKLNLGAFNQYAVILPFFIIKFLVDFYQIKNSGTLNNTVVGSLQQ